APQCTPTATTGRCLVVTVALQREVTTAAAVGSAQHTHRPYRYPNACLEDLEAFMTLWDVKPRVEESSLETISVDELITQLRQACEDAEDRASNAQEEAQQKRKEALEEVIQRIYRNKY
ncbi:hypothetical protein Tco_0221682, partial [Tanacetum coccineum]